MRKTEIMRFVKPLSKKERSEIIKSFYQKYSNTGEAGHNFFISQLDESKEKIKDLDLYNYHQQELFKVYSRLPSWVAERSQGDTLYALIDKKQVIRCWLWDSIDTIVPQFSCPFFVREYWTQNLGIEEFKKVYPNHRVDSFFVEKEIYKKQSNLPFYHDFSALLYDDGIGVIRINLGAEFMHKVWRAESIQIKLGEIDKKTAILPMSANYERHRPRKDSYSTWAGGYFDLKTLSFTQSKN